MIGERIKKFRKEKEGGRTLKEVSKETGLSISFLCDIERGRTMPSLKTCQKLATLYGVPLWIFFLGIEIQTKED